MTITSTASEISYAGDGVTVAFPIPFVFDTAADLKVSSTDEDGNVTILTTGFSVSGGNGSTGTLTFGTAPASTVDITILDNPEIKQATDYVSNDPFPAESHERALDRLTRICKRLTRQFARSLHTQDGDPISDLTLGSVDNRKGKYLFFNAITGAIEYAANVVTTTLSQSIIGVLLNPQTLAEAAASVLPVNYAVESHDKVGHVNVLRYMTAAQFANVVARTGTIDVTAAIQMAINVAQQVGNCRVYLPSGVYLVTSELTITSDRIHFVGAGVYATQITFTPAANGTCLKISKVAATTINQGSVRDICFRSNDATYTKTAIELIDMSWYVLDNVVIGGSVDMGGAGGWSGGTGSIGIRTRGRDQNSFLNMNIAADRPIVISPLLSPGIEISLDHTNFHNMILFGGAFPCITIEAGCVLTQVSFTGWQSGVLGEGWLYWVDATTPGSSNGLSVEHVRYENTLDATAYFMHIDVASPLQMLTVKGGQTGGGRGFYLRGAQRTHFDSFFYSDVTREALNANATVGEMVFTNCLWNTGSTATLTGLTVFNRRPSQTSGPLPNNGFITVTPTASNQETVECTIGGNAFSVAQDAKTVIGSRSQLGFIVIADDTVQVTAIYELRGTNNAVSEISDPGGFYTVTADNANTYNVYYDATALSGAGGYVIQNKRAATAVFRVMRLGRA